MANFSIHYDGPITTDHHVSVRVMARTYEHMQRAIDRAYLINLHGNVWKHARLKAIDYPEVEFIAAYPREGGIILDAIRNGAQTANEIIDRIGAAIAEPFERALHENIEEAVEISRELGERRAYVRGMQERTMPFQAMLDRPPAAWADRYSDRSIVKEIDQLTNPIASQKLDGSTVDIGLLGNYSHPIYHFDAGQAQRFHKIVSRRELGPALIINARIRDLDKGNNYAYPKAKILNLDSNREVTLHLADRSDVEQLHPFHLSDSVRIYACPFIEGGGFDLRGGDLYFVAVVVADL